MRIAFLGAAGTVTGSKFLVEAENRRVLVDCGLFQGLKALRRRNWEPFPVPPESIDAVVLTHAHLDHSGALPMLVRDGFGGQIFCTPPTAKLCDIILPDSGRIQEQDAEYANRKNISKHQPALPLYTEEDALRVTERLRTVPFRQATSVGPFTITLEPAGHLLGAGSVHVAVAGAGGRRSILFSGDLGRPGDPVMFPPSPPPEADWVVMESTYGDHRHPPVDPEAAIARILRDTVQRKGVLLIPAFAVGRAQSLLYWLNRVFDGGMAPRIPLYVDSPMASDVSALYREFADYHRISPAEIRNLFGEAKFVASVEESKWLSRQSGPMVIVSASGMMTGGRILHHVKSFGPRPETTILLAGFQAPGTRGAALLAGADELKIHGGYVEIRARVESLEVLSAHADQAELLAWLGSAPRPPRRVFLVHGEPAPAEALCVRIRDHLRIHTTVPSHGTSVDLAAWSGGPAAGAASSTSVPGSGA
jgi:metallo-beta-lactamase family protein